MKFTTLNITVLVACALGIVGSALGYQNSFTNKSTKTAQVTINWKCGRTETLTIEPDATLSCEGSCPVLFISLDVDGERIGRWVPISKVVGHFYAESAIPQSLEYVGDGSWIILEVTDNNAKNHTATKQTLTLWKVK